MNYVQNMEIIIASAVIWVTPVLVALIMTCGMMLADLKEPAESQLTSEKGQMYDLAEWLTLAGNDYPRGNDFDIYVAERNVIKGVLEGITSYETVHSEKESDSVRELKTLYEAIRHQQWKESRAPEWDVRSHEPMKFGSEPIPEIEKIEGENDGRL